MGKKADISIQILIVAVIAVLVMVIVIFIFTGKTRFFTQTVSSCSTIGICATSEDGCVQDSNYPIPVVVEDKSCEYKKDGLKAVKADLKDKLRLCCQRVGE